MAKKKPRKPVKTQADRDTKADRIAKKQTIKRLTKRGATGHG